jgi:hypothetical protein
LPPYRGKSADASAGAALFLSIAARSAVQTFEFGIAGFSGRTLDKLIKLVYIEIY